ncbi:hypothetical protein [Algihabitans albus]|uniref:hypothetical protein n=1 Tax=Algihabitans albus TaxID=2164067 RepID=UPI0013C2CAD2|nr:hypothetical protein [Algihabitans albus]
MSAIVQAVQDHPQPYFDEAGGVLPIDHVLRALARISGSAGRTVKGGGPDRVQAVAAERAGPAE